MVNRVTQKYLSADKMYRSRSPSGETEEYIQEHLVKYYHEVNSGMKDGMKKLAPSIKFIGVVEKLAEHPNISAAVGYGSSSSAAGYSSSSSERMLIWDPNSSTLMAPADSVPSGASSVSTEDERCAGNMPFTSPSPYRPSA